MIPPYPMPLPVLGPALYGQFCLGLCRALAAPWLDACSPPRSRHEPGAAVPCAAAEVVAEATAPVAARTTACQVIHVPIARWQQRRGAGAAGAAH